MASPATAALLALLLLPPAPAPAPAGTDPAVGGCTRKEEFAKRQAEMDELVLALGAAKDDRARRRAAARIVKAAERDVENLVRYREAAVAPVLAEVLRTSRKWFVRSRAAAALRFTGGPAEVPALAGALDDDDPSVREAAASSLGHVGGVEARAALAKRLEREKDPHVRATLEAFLPLAGGGERPWARTDGKEWKEELDGPEGARRVAWAWTVKGKNLFNDYDARSTDYPAAERFVFPVLRYEEDLFAGYPRKSYGAGGTHAGEDHAWFRDGCGYYAVADGIVRMVQGAGGDWGFLVAVEHRLPSGRYLTSVYGHAGSDILVRPGEVVRAGQRIASQGLSCSVENGGYGAHLHFGLGDGPFRRPAGMATGDAVNLDLGGGKTAKVPVLRMVYAADGRNSFGWPLTAFVVRNPDGTERTVEVPEQPVGRELGWFQAYVKDCRGWLDPQKWLPDLVAGRY